MHLVCGKCTPFFYNMTNYELMARLMYGIGMSFPNIKTSKTYKFEFENFGSDKTVLCKTYVTYGKERKSTYRKRIFFIRNCALFRKTHLSFRTFFTDKLRTYGAFSVRNRYVLHEYKNVHKTYQFRVRFFIGMTDILNIQVTESSIPLIQVVLLKHVFEMNQLQKYQNIQ